MHNPNRVGRLIGQKSSLRSCVIQYLKIQVAALTDPFESEWAFSDIGVGVNATSSPLDPRRDEGKTYSPPHSRPDNVLAAAPCREFLEKAIRSPPIRMDDWSRK